MLTVDHGLVPSRLGLDRIVIRKVQDLLRPPHFNVSSRLPTTNGLEALMH
jgi:hypothetical protein